MKTKGYIMVLTAAVLWGLSGTVAQYLFQNTTIRPEWIVSVRQLSAGILLLILAMIQGQGKNILLIWKEPKNRFSLLLFGVVGMLGVQFTYFKTIQLSNAATATLLQYLAPAMIVFYVMIQERKRPTPYELAAIFLALVGTFFLVTNGSIDKLSITTVALIWGLVSAIALAFYTLYPVRLLQQFSSAVTIGWGMIIGGISLSFIQPVWRFELGTLSFSTMISILFIIVFGTFLAFYLYIDSLRYISATETSLLANAEPLTAVIAAVLFLQTSFGFFEILGGFFIIGTVILITMQPKEKVSAKVTV